MANIQDRGKQRENRWQARYRDPDGRQVSKSFRRKIDADRWLKQVESDMTTGRYVDPKAGRVTLESFAKDWLESQTYDDSTREAVESRFRVHILSQLGHIELRNIRPSTVQSWLRSRQTECAPSYVRVMLANLSGVLGAAVDDGLIASNPCQSRSVKPPAVEDKLVVPWTAEMVQRSSLRILSDTRRCLSLPPVSGCVKVRCSASGSSMSTFSGSGSWCVNK